MTEEDKKTIQEVSADLKEYIEKKFGKFEDMTEENRNRTFLKMHAGLVGFAKRDFNYVLVIENKNV